MPENGGPVQYLRMPDCNDSNPLFTLPVPATVIQSLSEDQRKRIAKIQIDFAQRVSRALLRSYAEINVVLGGEPRAPRGKQEPQE